ncbi:MAG: asparagine synthetase B, partial [Bacteroidota bacterium]
MTYLFKRINCVPSRAQSRGIYSFQAKTRNFLFTFFLFLFSFSITASVILIPMDAESQENHLKAYGITYWVLTKQQKVQWLLNYRGGSFLLPDGEVIRKECQIRGVSFEV